MPLCYERADFLNRFKVDRNMRVCCAHFWRKDNFIEYFRTHKCYSCTEYTLQTTKYRNLLVTIIIQNFETWEYQWNLFIYHINYSLWYILINKCTY